MTCLPDQGEVTPVILCGGDGVRLWPLARPGRRKPFMRPGAGPSLLEHSVGMADAVCGRHPIVLVAHADSAARALAEAARSTAHDVLALAEPEGRGTGPAIVLAACELAQRLGRDALLLVMPSDQLIDDRQGFAETIAEASALARSGDRLVLVGIRPTAASSEFGHIAHAGGRVTGFTEKPQAELAASLWQRGGHLWNAGMVVATAGAVLDAAARHAAPVLAAVEAGLAAARPAGPGDTLLAVGADFAAAPDIAFDHAVLEKADNLAVVPARFAWRDLGTWPALSALTEPDAEGNRVVGPAILVDSRNIYVESRDRLVGVVGLEDVIVIDTDDAVLVAHKGAGAALRRLAPLALGHPSRAAPALLELADYAVTLITLAPGDRHEGDGNGARGDLINMLEGRGHVEVDGRRRLLASGSSRRFAPGQAYVLRNTGALPLQALLVRLPAPHAH